MEVITKKHGEWANMMVELYSQHEKTVSNVEKIVDRLKNPKQNNLDAEIFTSPGF
jgi:hypothetical protein